MKKTIKTIAFSLFGILAIQFISFHVFGKNQLSNKILLGLDLPDEIDTLTIVHGFNKTCGNDTNTYFDIDVHEDNLFNKVEYRFLKSQHRTKEIPWNESQSTSKDYNYVIYGAKLRGSFFSLEIHEGLHEINGSSSQSSQKTYIWLFFKWFKTNEYYNKWTRN